MLQLNLTVTNFDPVLGTFQKIAKSNFMEIRPVGVDFFFYAFRPLGRDTTRLIVTFRKFANSSEDSQASGQAAYVPLFMLKQREVSDTFFAMILSSSSVTWIRWAS
jgi:hypothetical protein